MRDGKRGEEKINEVRGIKKKSAEETKCFVTHRLVFFFF